MPSELEEIDTRFTASSLPLLRRWESEFKLTASLPLRNVSRERFVFDHLRRSFVKM